MVISALYTTYLLVTHDETSRSSRNSIEFQTFSKEEKLHGVADMKNINQKPKKKKVASKKGSSLAIREPVKEVRHVAFLKVHKTASSTAQNVFLRFGSERNLTFLLAHTQGESGWLNVISFNNSLTKDNIVPPPPGQHYDILCCHVIYNRGQFQKFMPKDTTLIGIVREPIKRFQSAVKYFIKSVINKIKGDHPLTKYAENPLAYEPTDPRESQTNNRMAVEFGFPLELFPGKSLDRSQKDIEKYLQRIDKEFKFIIISERFDESMVYMKRILHWKTKDILYIDQNVSKKTNPKKVLQDKDKPRVSEFLYLDRVVYNFSLSRFEKQISAEGTDFVREVEHFRKVKGRVETFCNGGKETALTFERSKWSPQFIVTKAYCGLFSMHEKKFIQNLRYKMYGVLDN